MLDKPLSWRKSRRIFVNSMSDLFHPDVPFEFIDQVFAVMAITPLHTYQILTKRPERMAGYSISRADIFRNARCWEHPVQQQIEGIINTRTTPEDAGLWEWPLRNVWLGTSVEDQAAADERIPHLLKTPTAVRFLSCEPLLGAVFFDHLNPGGLHWLIAGGESGPNARPCNVEWIREIVHQGHHYEIPTFVKQLGAKPYDADGLLVIKDTKGGNPIQWPEDLRVREFPASRVPA